MTVEDRLGHVIISNITINGEIDKLKKINIGDEILGFDDFNLLKMEFDKVENLLKNASKQENKVKFSNNILLLNYCFIT